MGKGIWGIDVSKYSVKAVRLEPSGDTFVLTHAEVTPYFEEGTAEPGNLDDQIRLTLEEMKARLRIGRERVVLSLPGHSTFNRPVKLPPVDDSKIAEVVRYEAQSQIPFNIDEVIWDYQFVERPYGPGEEKEVIVFAIKRDVVEQFLKNLEPLSLNVEAVQFAPVALYNFLVKDQDVGNAAVALDMGGDNTDLVIIDGPKFWIRNLPITGNDITKALQKAFNIPYAEAEKLKLRAPQSQQAQKIYNAIQPTLRDLIGEVNRSIGYYKSLSKTIKFDRVVLLGNATKTLNFQKFASQSLNMPAAHISKLNHIHVAGTIDPASLSEDLGTLGTAIGLALQGFGATHNKINLLPPIYVQKKQIKKKQPYIVGIAAALYAIVLLVWLNWSREVEALQTARDAADRANKTAQVQTQKKADAEKETKKLEEPLKTIADISYERDLLLKVMNLILPNIPNNGDRALPDDKKLWILDWEFEEKSAKKPETAAPGALTHIGLPAGQQQGPPYVAEKRLCVTIEVCVLKQNHPNSTAAANWVAQTLLGVTPDGKQIATKPSVVATFGLTREGPDLRWGIQPRDETARLIPAKVAATHPTTEEAEKLYYRFDVTLELPMKPHVREEAKKPSADASKPTPKPETPKQKEPK